jgi:hypothetical protein
VQTVQNQFFSVYPNPASDWLELSGLPEETATVLVKNVLGQILITENKRLEKSLRLNVSDLNPGQYVITILGSNALTSLSFQKI